MSDGGRQHPEVRLSVIVPVLNAMAYLTRTLPAFAEAVRLDGTSELVVVDNGSRDGSWEFIREFPGVSRAIQVPNTRVGGVRNAGGDVSSGSYLCFLDADCLVDSNYLAAVRTVIRERGHDVFGSRYLLPPSPDWIEQTWHDLHSRSTDGVVDYLNGGNLVISRRAWNAVGGFNAELPSGEDAALCFSLEKLGYHTHHDSRVRTYHLGNPKTLHDFFRQQLWHASGMLGSRRGMLPDKVTVSTATHLVLTAFACAAMFVPVSVVWRALSFGALICLVPAATVAYRWTRAKTPTRPAHAVALYLLYFSARGVVLLSELIPTVGRHARQRFGRRSRD